MSIAIASKLCSKNYGTVMFPEHMITLLYDIRPVLMIFFVTGQPPPLENWHHSKNHY